MICVCVCAGACVCLYPVIDCPGSIALQPPPSETLIGYKLSIHQNSCVQMCFRLGECLLYCRKHIMGLKSGNHLAELNNCPDVIFDF